MSGNARLFIQLAREARAIANSEADWSTKHDLIFSTDISQTIFPLNIHFYWCDPDESEETDVLAFVNAINAKADELEKAFAKGEHP